VSIQGTGNNHRLLRKRLGDKLLGALSFSKSTLFGHTDPTS
jgi:hypothetical protein